MADSTQEPTSAPKRVSAEDVGQSPAGAEMANTRQIDRALLLFVATTAATSLATVSTSWLGAKIEVLSWLPGAWGLVVGFLMWVVLPLVHFRLQVEDDPPALLSLFSGVASWLVGAAFTLYWHAVT